MTEITPVSGGVCAPEGFRAGGVYCGIAKNAQKPDLALIASDTPCSCAATYTANKVKAAPLGVTREHLQNGRAQAVICNSGNANACMAGGAEVARGMCGLAADMLGIPASDVVVASTGVIGQPLPLEKVQGAAGALARSLRGDGAGSRLCATAMMTTDTVAKEISVRFPLGGKACKLGGVAKGSGMIHPNMGTMLCFLTTDAAISPALLQQALSAVVRDTFNMVSVDGDTSTNDMAVVLANGRAGNPIVDRAGADYDAFADALSHVCTYLARMMAKDGEGATKLLECAVGGAVDDPSARLLAKSVISSSLVKAAMFGSDANWGRVLCAMGYSGAAGDLSRADITFASRAGAVAVCREGAGLAFDEEMAKRVLGEEEIEIQIQLHQGDARAVAWGCDLTLDYVRINGDYRS